MKITNVWYRLLLGPAMSFSYLIIALSVFLIPKELSNHGVIPLRIIIMLSFAFITLLLNVYFTEEPAWKTIVKFFGKSTGLVALMVGVYGFSESLYQILGEASELSLAWAITTAVIGISVALLIGKGINSKWLS